MASGKSTPRHRYRSRKKGTYQELRYSTEVPDNFMEFESMGRLQVGGNPLEENQGGVLSVMKNNLAELKQAF